MRLWHIPVIYLDSRRLTSQHYECHGLLTCCLTQKKWGSISTQFEKSCQYIVLVHNTCVEEMFYRKGRPGDPFHRHPSPMEADTLPTENTSENFTPSLLHLRTDTVQLRNKWEREGYYFGTGRVDLGLLEQHQDLPRPRSLTETERMRQETRRILKTHKDFLEKTKGKHTIGDKLDILFRHLGEDLLGRKKHPEVLPR